MIDTQQVLDEIVEKTLERITINKNEVDVAQVSLQKAKRELSDAMHSLASYVVISRGVEDKDSLPMKEQDAVLLIDKLDKGFSDFIE
tara:strand:+ start:792 stop:1052 length:261 start_codon:yes stop_codon:yes gene_type:complete